MIDVSEEYLEAASGSRIQRLRVESWLDGELITDDIPISDGTLAVDRSLNIPERLSLTIPREDGDVIWAPVQDEDPLAAMGQQLVVSVGIDIAPGITEWAQIAWMLILDVNSDDDTVDVEAAGLLQYIEEAKFVSPFQPDGTFKSTIRDLVEPALTVQFDDDLTDRNIPSGMQWDEDRLGALTEVLDAWPAEAIVLPDSTLYIRETIGPLISEPVVAPFPKEVVWEFDDRDEGTVIEWQGGSSRTGLFNLVVSRGEDSDGNPIQGVASNIESISPTRVGGPFSPFPVPFDFHSPLLTTVEECRKSAARILRRKTRLQTSKVEVTTIPNPALQVGDTVQLFSDNEIFDKSKATVEAFTLPLVPQGGPMSVTLSVYEWHKIVRWRGINLS